MRTLGEFKLIKDDVLTSLRSHGDIQKVFEIAEKGPAIFREDVKLQVRAHWGQTMTVELTEVDQGPEVYLGYKLKEVVRQAVPWAQVFAAEVKPRRTVGTVTIVHFKVPDALEELPVQKSA